MSSRPQSSRSLCGGGPLSACFADDFLCWAIRTPGWKWMIAAVLVSAFIAAPVGGLTTLQIQKFVILALVWFIGRRPLSHDPGNSCVGEVIAGKMPALQ